jgi:GNAT superfamily N-acetyltransferase
MWEEIGGRSARQLDRADANYRRWIRQEMAAGRFFGFVAEDSGARPLASGVVWLAPSQPRPPPLDRSTMPYIMSMYTEPSARRRGLALLLVRRMIAFARQRKYGRIYLNASRFGRPVYARLGFVEGNEMRLNLLAPPTVRRR